jgi:hypothetical protein
MQGQLFSQTAHAFLTSSITGFAVGALLLVVAWKMNAIGANLILMLSWMAFTWAVFQTPIIQRQELLTKILSIMVFSSVLALAMYYVLWSASGEKLSEALLNSQIPEVREIQKFIGSKHEVELRDLFDFPRMVKFNVRLAKRSISPPNTLKPNESSEIDTVFQGGQALLDRDFCRVTTTQGGGFHVDWVPGKIGVVNMTKQYLDNEQTLAGFELSPLLPSRVCRAIKEFHKSLSDNMSLMLVVINEQFAKDQRSITSNEDSESPFYGSIPNNYWHRFNQLAPKRDKIIDEIRRYLRIR